MRLYTKTGDDGTTGLFGAGRVRKDHPRIEAYGGVDELNSVLGLVAAACDPARAHDARVLELVALIQSRLFDIGADLATPPGAAHEDKIQRTSAADVAEAERWIDEMDGGNAPIRAFVMPGGTELAARLHMARTVARRAERAVVALMKTEPVGVHVLHYVNRLSDLFFAMARRANRDRGVPDVPWIPRKT